MKIISELISNYNVTENTNAMPFLTRKFVEWVTQMVNIFGLNGTAAPLQNSIGWSGLDVPEDAKPILKMLSSLRDQLRLHVRSPSGVNIQDLNTIIDSGLGLLPQALEKQRGTPFTAIFETFVEDLLSIKDSGSFGKDVLRLTDRVRDVDLWEKGIYLEDRDSDQPALIRPVTKELLAAKKEKDDRERQKQEAKIRREQEATAKATKGRISHKKMFRTDDFSAWDEGGVPTKDREGVEIAKSRRKKLQKDWERQKKLHETWLMTNTEEQTLMH